MAKEDGGSAFPAVIKSYVDLADPSKIREDYYSGMTLRDWFAGMALNANLSCEAYKCDSQASAAKDAYEFADAMLKARKE